MGLGSELEHADRFAAYVNELTKALGHADREKPFRDYCAGLLATEGRRSVEPMAVVTDPGRVSVQHQKLLHLVADSPWSDEKMLAKVREQVVPEMTRRGPIEVWIIDDTGFPKKGTHSVGVHHQYCGQLGKQANCQVAVTLSIANHHASLPIAYRLYLPREWADDKDRRKEARVPASIRFKTKPQIALEQIRAALLAGVPPGVVLMDSSYGNNSKLRQDQDWGSATWPPFSRPPKCAWCTSARSNAPGCMALTKDKRSPSTLFPIEGRASPRRKICAPSDRQRENHKLAVEVFH
jgi:SRSO17 transposase